MRFLFLIALFVIVSCKPKEREEKIYGPDDKLKYIYKIKGDVKTIFDYAKDGKLMMKLKFKQDQFIDTIYYYDFDDHYLTIDSSDGKYFYGKQILMLDKTHYGYTGYYRFRKNNNPKKAFESQLKYGKHTTYSVDGSIREQLEFKIIGDSSFVIKAIKATQ